MDRNQDQKSEALTILPNTHIAGRWSDEDRKAAAVAFVIYGNVKQVAQITSIPDKTIYGWIKSSWWPGVLEEAKRDHQELIESRFSDILEKITTQLIDRIENGDEYIDRKGNRQRIKVKAKELGKIAVDIADRIRISRNQPTKIKAELRFDPDKIAKEFADIAERNREKIVSEQ